MVKFHPSIEPLEARVAPAALLSPTTVSYEDVDGSLVTIKFSKPIFTSVDTASAVDTANAILHFDTGAVTDPALNMAATPQQLQLIDLSATALAQGANLTISAKHNPAVAGSDALANVGAIDAGAHDLGTIKIAGDLGRIVAGDATYTTPAVKALTVQSMGVFGTTTQESGGGLTSTLTGAVGKIVVKSNLQNAYLAISAPGADSAKASLASLTVGGSLVGSALVTSDSFAHSGSVSVTGKIGPITVAGSLIGGFGASTGSITAQGAIGPVKVGGSILGGTGEDSGSIQSTVSIGAVTVAGDLRGGGNATDNTGEDSGVIDGGGAIGQVAIHGTVAGGGDDSGSVRAENFGGKIAGITVGGDLVGGPGDGSGYLHADTSLGLVKITGSVQGGSGRDSGNIYAGSIADPHVMKGVTILGDLRGGTGDGSGSIGAVFNDLGTSSLLSTGKIYIHGDVVGNAQHSASINANSITSLTIGGSLLGGPNMQSGAIVALGKVGKLSIGGRVVGGAGASSALIECGSAGSIAIAHDLLGGGGDSSGTIESFSNVASIMVGGDLRSGTGTGAGAISIGETLGSVTIKGSVLGTSAHPAVIEAEGARSQIVSGFRPAAAFVGLTPAKLPAAIGKATIGGSATYLQILAGYDFQATAASNGDASIGALTVAHDWVASSISAGCSPGNGQFGDSDDSLYPNNNDPAVTARIASITIKGQLLGTPASVSNTDSFGFDAEKFGTIKIGTAKFTPPVFGTPLALGATGDFHVQTLGPST